MTRDPLVFQGNNESEEIGQIIYADKRKDNSEVPAVINCRIYDFFHL